MLLIEVKQNALFCLTEVCLCVSDTDVPAVSSTTWGAAAPETEQVSC
jgi:hypothetical protein